MGSADRKEREKEELRDKILASAKVLFLEKGVETTSIRNIADRIEYSPGIIYHYFKDKNEILHALHQDGFRQLIEKMSVLVAVSQPMERLKAMGRIYIDFALQNPDMYDLMFIKEAPMEHLTDCKEDHWLEGRGTFDFLRKTIADCMESGHFKGQDHEALSFMIWSVVHGMVSLQIRQRCKVIQPEREDNIVWDGVGEFLRIIEKV